MPRGRRCFGSGRLWRRNGRWLLDYRTADGRRCHKTLGTDRRTAEAIRARIIEQRNLQTFGLLDVAGQQRTFAEVVDAYLLDLQPRVVPRHYSQVEARLRKVMAKLPGVRVGDLRVTDVARLRAEVVAAGHGNRAANLLADAVRACLRWAVDAELIAKSPIAKLKRLPEAGHERRRRRALSEDEIGRLLFAAEEDDRSWAPMHQIEGRLRIPQAPLFRTLIETGLRYGEARTLRWGDVDLGPRLLVVRAENAKSRRQRVIPIRVALADELRALKVLHERALRRLPTAAECVFLSADGVPYGGPTTNLMRVFRRVLRRAGIQRVVVEGQSIDIHALRTTSGSRLARAGVGLAIAQKLLGHSDPKLTARHYVALGVEDVRRAIEAVGPSRSDQSAMAAPGRDHPRPVARAREGSGVEYDLR